MIIDPKLLEQLENSTCFGIAHSKEAKECKQCDVQMECMAKTANNSLFNEMKTLSKDTDEALQKAKLKKESKKQDKKTQEKTDIEGLPDMKGMSVEELKTMLSELGGICKEYDNQGIYKMRLIMAIKEFFKNK